MAKEKSFNRNVLVEFWPVNADARTDKLPVAAFARPPLRQSWIPLQRNRDAPTIRQVDDDGVTSDPNVFCRRSLSCQT